MPTEHLPPTPHPPTVMQQHVEVIDNTPPGEDPPATVDVMIDHRKLRPGHKSAIARILALQMYPILCLTCHQPGWVEEGRTMSETVIRHPGRLKWPCRGAVEEFPTVPAADA